MTIIDDSFYFVNVSVSFLNILVFYSVVYSGENPILSQLLNIGEKPFFLVLKITHYCYLKLVNLNGY